MGVDTGAEVSAEERLTIQFGEDQGRLTGSGDTESERRTGHVLFGGKYAVLTEKVRMRGISSSSI